MTEEEVREKVRLNRIELLKKAREAKAAKKLERSKVNDNIVEKILKEPEVIVEEKPKKVRAKKQKEVKQEIEVKPEVKAEVVSKKKEKAEIVEEVVRIPANHRKKIVKRTIEIEESETDEEVVEEIVKIPKMKKEIKFSRDEMKTKLINQNLNRLNNELFQ
jgi:hypothetical protein